MTHRNLRDNEQQVDNILEFKETVDNTPTLSLSGGLFVSGGALYYKGSGGTVTAVGTA